MGYSHYWYRPHGHDDGEAFRLLAHDARKIITAAREREGIEVAGWDGSGVPEFDEHSIRLNGCAPESCESFGWEARPMRAEWVTDESSAFGSVKTRQYPYDAVVCAILIRAKLIYGEFVTISSDGSWDDDWRDGRRVYLATFGVPAPWCFDQYLARVSA